MKISLQWLQDHIDLSDLSTDQIADTLTEIGLEVEEVHKFSSLKSENKGVVAGEVLKTWPHPNADKLRVTEVSVGTDQLLQIVCGAPNVATGQKVAVATVGARLVMEDGGELKIKKGKIRGEVSMGMLCAEDELGLGKGHDGILILPEDTELGTSFVDLFPKETDTVFEIGLTPNRVDAANHRGVAFDLAAKLGKSLLPLKSLEKLEAKTSAELKINIEAPEACHEFNALICRNIAQCPTPEWMVKRLKAIGISSMSILVDIGNYTMLDTGHPVHFFDLDKIQSNQIVIRMATKGEKLKTLDGVDRELSGAELLVCDDQSPIALAGVMGGDDSAVSEKTKNVLIESAYFDPTTIRRSAKSQQIATDASFRFERGADFNAPKAALAHCLYFVKSICNAEVDTEMQSTVAKELSKVKIELSHQHVLDLIGNDISSETIIGIFKSLDFKVISDIDGTWTVEIPSNKPDVTRNVDVIEEILRIYGYNEIVMDDRMTLSIPKNKWKPQKELKRKISQILTGSGFHEIKTNPFDQFRSDLQVEVANPMSQDQSHLRLNPVSSGLSVLAHNINRQQKNLSFFEIANAYSLADDNYREQNVLSIWMTGKQKEEESWYEKNADKDWYQLKSIAEKLLRGLDVSFGPLQAMESSDLFEVGYQSFREEIKLGRLNAAYTKEYGVAQEVFFAQIDMKALLKKRMKNKVKFQELNKYPQMVRDLSLVLGDGKKYHDIQEAVKKTKTKFLIQTTCFDKYQGNSLADGSVSYGIRFVFENRDKTLHDKQVGHEMNLIILALENIGCEIRK